MLAVAAAATHERSAGERRDHQIEGVGGAVNALRAEATVHMAEQRRNLLEARSSLVEMYTPALDRHEAAIERHTTALAKAVGQLEGKADAGTVCRLMLQGCPTIPWE